MLTTAREYDRRASAVERLRLGARMGAGWLARKGLNWRVRVEHDGRELAAVPVGVAAMGAVLFPKATLLAGALCLAARCRLSLREAP